MQKARSDATRQMLRGQEAVISAFNPGWKNPRLYEDQIKGTASILAAITKAGLRRVLWVGGAGGLEVGPFLHPYPMARFDASHPRWKPYA